jgi:predicted dehydrogenase
VIRVAVVGCGYWGPNVVRNLEALDDAGVRTVCDIDPERLEPLRRRYPSVRLASDVREVLEDPEVDALAICTPIETHYALASAALRAGKHVLVEKPMTHSLETAERLVAEADDAGLVLQVDHTFVYTDAVRKIRDIIDAGEIGELLYVDAVRINLGLFQSDVNVVWDLAPHDVSVFSHLIDRRPLWVSAIGSTHYGAHETQAYLTIGYDDALIAHLHVNWLAPVKIRSTLIGGSRRMIVYDDLAPTEKIRIYDKGVSLSNDRSSRDRALVDYRLGDMFAPHLDRTEPLSAVCRNFVDAIAHGTPPLTDGRAGLDVVRILAYAQESIAKDGERIRLPRLA